MQQKKSARLTSIRYLKGVGPAREALCRKLQIETVNDLLFYLPRRYEDRSHFVPIRSLVPGALATVAGQVIAARVRSTKRGLLVFELTLSDGTGVIRGVWFNQPYLQKFFRAGQRLILYGKVEYYGRLQINQPEYEVMSDTDNALHIGRIVPLYPLTQGISHRYLRTLVHTALRDYLGSVPETMPAKLRARYHVPDIHRALQTIHFPQDMEAVAQAYRRLVFEEFFLLQLLLAISRASAHRAGKSPSPAPGAADIRDTFCRQLPFSLTDAQRRVMDDIDADLQRDGPMNRLIEGDVGSGKTVVGAYAAYRVVRQGKQAAIMAPTDILAKQHFVTLSELFMPLGLSVELLVSDLAHEDKTAHKHRIAAREVDVVIGTHAVIQDDVAFADLGLVLIDEQHKFGVHQRARLQQKGHRPHVLVMTATPIPRSLAMTVYGDLDLSVIEQVPAGRGGIETYWVDEDERERIYGFIRDEVAKGRQAYVICPLVDDSEKTDATSVLAAYDRLRTEVFRDISVGLVHGKMKVAERDEVMKQFKKKKVMVLVSTTVVEVGVDIPNATVMLIESAERFGLSQLHQLRGRIGRGEHDSYCILMSHPRTAAARERLKAIQNSTDGFAIAEEDLRLRGPGEVCGTRQHGIPSFRFGNLLTDRAILEEARAAACALVEEDPGLNDPTYYSLRRLVNEQALRRNLELSRVG